MEIEFRKKYEIIKSVINNLGDVEFTIADLHLMGKKVAETYGITIEMKDVAMVILDLYDSYEVAQVVLPDNKVCFRKSLFYGEYEEYVSTR